MASRDDHSDSQAPTNHHMSDHEWQAFFNEQQAHHEQLKQQIGTSMDPALYKNRHVESERAYEPTRDDNNPFVAFRHFVDANLHAFADSFRSLPSNVADLRSISRDKKQERREQYQRWTGEEEGSERRGGTAWDTASPGERQCGLLAMGMLMGQSMSPNSVGADAEDTAALWEDEATTSAPINQDPFATPSLSPGGACYYVRETDDNLPSTANSAQDDREPRWLSPSWFRRSPYSPVALEPLQETTTITYRAAFEDLISASLGKPLRPIAHPLGSRWTCAKDVDSVQSAWEAPGVDWMLSLYCRRILPWPCDRTLEEISQVVDELREAVVVRSKPVEFGGYAARKGMSDQLREGLGNTREQRLHDSEVSRLASELCQKELEALEASEERWQQEKEALGLLDESVAERPSVRVNDQTTEEWAASASHGDGACSGQEEGQFVEKSAVARDDKAWRHFYEAHNGVLEAALAEALQEPTEDSKRESNHHAPSRPHEYRDEETSRLAAFPSDRNDEKEVKEQPNVNVLSALTTTHTTRLPDGTVTTKVVLKQRFADGREETEEKTHTYQEHGERSQQKASKQAPEKPKTGGWFWT